MSRLEWDGIFCKRHSNFNFPDFSTSGAIVVHIYFLPLYFQTIRGVSPISSGIHLLPLIIALAVFSVAAAAIITSKGMPMFVMLSGAVMTCVASGLVYTFDIDTLSSKWIGVLTLLGLGYGFTTGLGILVGQLSCKKEDIAVATAALNCNPYLIGLTW
jgi:MFS transporter, DHA2 family, glioxin efflux transporter